MTEICSHPQLFITQKICAVTLVSSHFAQPFSTKWNLLFQQSTGSVNSNVFKKDPMQFTGYFFTSEVQVYVNDVAVNEREYSDPDCNPN